MDTDSARLQTPEQLRQRLQDVRAADLHRLNKRLQRLQDGDAAKLAQLAADIEQSVAQKRWRVDHRPQPRPDNGLPIYQSCTAIKQALMENQVLIVCGETGSGKTTQLPLYCLDIGRGIDGIIGHTQPRRIAARTVARRIADELGTTLGDQVGYKIRHQDISTENSFIKLMTDGILLTEMQHDRFLNRYDTLIIDEAHERSLNIDFILGYLKQLLPRRPDLKLIVTSATIDVERFSQHFDAAPIIEVSGKTYPVDVLYRPVDEEQEDTEREQYILEAISELSGYDTGDILVFLEGEGEIHETDKFLSKQRLPDTDILPLYSRLSSARQGKIFTPHKRRHIVLATNVAETSLTIPGIRFVIDTGMARISRYSPRSKVQRLPIEKVSRAAADQRKGRCGRTSEGICLRLYSEEDYQARPRFTQPEILRTNLASVILQMKMLRLGDMADFPFLEPPDEKLINDGVRVLKEINALDKQGQLTRTGRRLARLPLDPRYARMLVAAHEYHCLAEILVIVSALSIQDPRERPLDKTAAADKAHAQFNDEHSDFIWFLNVWRFYHQQLPKLSQSKLKKLCQQNFLSYVRMREWLDLHRQLRHICTEMKFSLNREAATYQTVHCAILTGLPSHVASLSDKHEYAGARNIKSYLFPASSQFEKKPKWVVAAELVETTRLYARQVAKIEPDWVIGTARHLLKYSYSNMHWDRQTARVVAHEATTLYGMTLRAGRSINFGKVNPTEARALFIRQALVEDDFDSGAGFLKHNQSLLAEIRGLETKTRRPDMLDEDAVYQFYVQQLPEDVFDGHTFNRWYQRLDKAQDRALCLSREDILLEQADIDIDLQFPDKLLANRMPLPVEYRFDPGSQDDGLNVDLPLELLNQFDNRQFDYLVPGLLEQKITVLLKSLPKPLRKQLVPVPDVAKECLQHIHNQDVPLQKNLSSYLFRTRGLRIAEEDWSETSLPDYLRVNYRVFDSDNHLLAQGRDLTLLRERLAEASSTAFHDAVTDVVEVEAIERWDFGDLPVSQKIVSGDSHITVYPSLVDEDGTIYRQAFDSRETAEYHFRYGLRALYKKMLDKDIRYLRKNLRDIERLALLYSAIGSRADLIESIVNQVIDETFLYEKKVIRKQEEFLALLEHGRSRLLLNAERLCQILKTLFTDYNQVMSRLQGPGLEHCRHAIDDIREQLDYLVFNGFVEDIARQHLEDYPRYLESVGKRLDKLEFGLEKDRKNTLLIADHWNRIKQLVDNAYETGHYPALLDEYRWMMEELRISIFTQELKTRVPVSLKRMDKKWAALQQLDL